MHVLYITHTTVRNGATIALLNIINEMINKGVDVSIVVPTKSGFLYDEAKTKGIHLIDNYSYAWTILRPDGKYNLIKLLLVWFKTIRMLLGAQRIFYKILKEYRPDIVHTNTSVICYPLIACYLLNIPHVWHAREYIDKDFGFRIIPGMNMLRKLMKLSFSHTIAITKGVFEHFDLNPQKDAVIYDGVIDNNFRKCPVEKKIFSYKYFLFVGNCLPAKGLDILLEQFCIFNKTNPDIHLNVAAGYDTIDKNFIYCKNIIDKHNLTNRVHFLGFREDVYSLMNEAIALIVPSRFEGFGFITVEAMANNCLVIGHNTAGTQEQFDNGLMESGSEIGLRYGDSTELPYLMERAINEDFSNLKKNARNVVLSKYTKQKNAEKLIEFYNNM